jgi:ketosteroid isomerase-like protein
MRKLPFILAVACLVAAVAASSISMAADSDEQSIHDTYNAWVEASNEKDIQKWSTFLAENPYFSPADSPPLTSTDEIIGYYERSFSDPWFSLDCEQEHVEVSESGEMAWARGKCSATFTGPDGKKASGTSRWFKVWIRQSDGSWRGRVNTWKYVDQP